MADQVITRDLPFGYRDVGNDPTPYVYQEITGSMALNFSYTQDHQGVVLESSRFNRRSMIRKSGWDTMLWKCCPIENSTEINNPRIIRHTRQQYILYVMTMDCDIPRDFLKYNTGGIHTITHSPLHFLIPLARKKYLDVILLPKKIEDKLPG